MAIITKITVQKKLTDRYNIFLDKGKGEEYAFSVDEDVLIKFNLRKGMELDDFVISEINYQDEIRKAYNLAIQYLARRMRAELEVRNYLAGKEISEPIIQEVIHKLYEYQFLNDVDFAQAYVRTQMKTTDKGIEVIKRELQEKGIKGEKLQKSLSEYPLEEQILKAKGLLVKAMKNKAKDSERILRQKAEQLLIRKGFPVEVIALAQEEVDEGQDEYEVMEALKYQGEKAHRKYGKFSGFEYEQKMKQALYRKGFSMDLINLFLEEKKQED